MRRWQLWCDDGCVVSIILCENKEQSEEGDDGLVKKASSSLRCATQ